MDPILIGREGRLIEWAGGASRFPCSPRPLRPTGCPEASPPGPARARARKAACDLLTNKLLPPCMKDTGGVCDKLAGIPALWGRPSPFLEP